MRLNDLLAKGAAATSIHDIYSTFVCLMKIIVSHPTGNEFVRSLIAELHDRRALAEFHTTVAADPTSVLAKLLPGPLRSEWLRRAYPVPSRDIRTHPLLELGRMVGPKLGFHSASKHETGIFSVDAVYRDLDKNVARRLASRSVKQTAGIVYAYEDGALQTFAAAKRHGIKCFYDLPIGYWKAARQMLGAERERWPDWAETLTGLKDSDEKLARKDEELRLADKIFVASSFTASTLDLCGERTAQVKIVPYGFPAVGLPKEYVLPSANRPLKLLFVGGLSQRKGIADVFAAVNAFKGSVELTVIGRKVTDDCIVLNEALKRHHYIPSLPHNEVMKVMREHDVLLFPSLFEGFGMVITEAMSQGTPVITTDRTAGPDIITHDADGWLIKAGDTDALITAIERLLTSPEKMAEAGKLAMITARKRPWSAYGSELADAIMS